MSGYFKQLASAKLVAHQMPADFWQLIDEKLFQNQSFNAFLEKHPTANVGIHGMGSDSVFLYIHFANKRLQVTSFAPQTDDELSFFIPYATDEKSFSGNYRDVFDKLLAVLTKQ